MARGDKKKTIQEKTPALRLTNELTEWLLRKLCNERLFPRRSRWLMSGKIADMVYDFSAEVYFANEIKAVTLKEWGDRHEAITLAIARLLALDAKVNEAVRVLEINPDEMQHFGTLVNNCKAKLEAWLNSDMKRYGSPPGLIHNEGSGQ